MKRYINDDKMPKRPRKIMSKISKEELWKKMCEFVGKELSYNEENSYTVLTKILHDCETVQIDMSTINVDRENLTCVSECYFGDNIVGDAMLGIQSINDEYTFFGFEQGGDWEYPVFIMIYYDGEKLRAYIPSCGNVVNLDFHCALGSEKIDWDNEIRIQKYMDIYSKVVAENPDMGDISRDDLEDGSNLERYYKMKYGMEEDSDDFGFNWELIEKDIKAMFKLI